MKKLILLPLIMAFMSCSSDDDNGANCQAIYDQYQEQIDYVLGTENPDQSQIELLREERRNKLADAGCSTNMSDYQ